MNSGKRSVKMQEGSERGCGGQCSIKLIELPGSVAHFGKHENTTQSSH